MDRTEYDFKITINGRCLSRIIVDQHYKERHREISDEIILNLVREIDGGCFVIEEETSGFQYFAVEPVIYAGKPYRLILLLCIHDDFLGGVNAFRVQRTKYD